MIDLLIEDIFDQHINNLQNKKPSFNLTLWISEVESYSIKDKQLKQFIKNQIVIWEEKDKKYSTFLETLIK
jgi:hypothetical protein